MSRSITVKLDYPFEHDGREISSLTFRRMKAKDALIGEGGEEKVKTGYMLYATLAGVPIEVIEELDMEDLEKIAEAVVPLMGKSAREELARQKAASSSSGET